MIDVLDMLLSYFEKDRETIAYVMTQLMPEDKSHEEFSLFLVGWKVSKLAKKPKDIFKALDKHGTGSLDHIEFINGITQTLDL